MNVNSNGEQKRKHFFFWITCPNKTEFSLIKMVGLSLWAVDQWCNQQIMQQHKYSKHAVIKNETTQSTLYHEILKDQVTRALSKTFNIIIRYDTYNCVLIIF